LFSPTALSASADELASAAQVDPQLIQRLLGELAKQMAGAKHPTFMLLGELVPAQYQAGDGNAVDLSWVYEQDGDYNADGEVNIADLTLVGQYFGARRGEANWEQAWVADGDHNGEITLGDVTPIGQNYGFYVRCYLVQFDMSYMDGQGWQPVLNVPFSAGDKSGRRIFFDAQLPKGGCFCRDYMPSEFDAPFKVWLVDEPVPEDQLYDVSQFPDANLWHWAGWIHLHNYAGYAPYKVTVEVQIVEHPGPYNIMLDFGDGTAPTRLWAVFWNEPIVEHVYSSPGSYAITGEIANVALGNSLPLGPWEVTIWDPTPRYAPSQPAQFGAEAIGLDSDITVGEIHQGFQ
jgi:hypothetical protein